MYSRLRSIASPTLVSLFTPLLLAVVAVVPVHGQDRPVREPFTVRAVTVEQMEERAKTHPFVPGEVVVALRLAGGRAEAEGSLRRIDWAERVGSRRASLDRTLLSFPEPPHHSIVLALVDLGTQDVFAAMRTLEDDSDVRWCSPNFYAPLEDPREYVPSDPQYGSQYHHPLMQNDLAWNTTLGDASIILAITDDGIDIDHQDLIANVWTNPGEVAANGIDDDGNGYVDDVNGWDFVSGNNNPNPNSSSDDHGTHVAGICAARTDNAVGVAGTAGQCTIMPLQFYSGSLGWTAATCAEAFAYAVDNGAQITTTSYNLDTWVGDPVYTAGLQYLYDQGGMHFNSGGNGGALNPPRQVFEQTFLVANTGSGDVLSGSSNYGTGTDVAAPGSSILSTLIGDTYGTKSGTSMASPNAAGVAALIWSQNPSWTREQVAAQLLATADNIDAANPGYAGWLGAGRVNSYRALTETVGIPAIEELIGLPADGSATDLPVASFEITFDQLMEPSSVNAPSHYDLRESGADGVFDTADDLPIAVTPTKEYMLGTNQMEFAIGGGALGLGSYRFTIFAGGLENPFGTDLDGDGDGVAGADFVTTFQIGPQRLEPAGSLVHELVRVASIDAPGEIDTFAMKLDAGQILSALVTSDGALLPVIEVRNPSGTLVASGTSIGSSVIVQGLAIAVAGNYEFSIYDAGSATGTYGFTVLLNALFEEEAAGGAPNDSAAAAEDLEPGSLAIGRAPATRLAAVGRTGIGEDFESGSLGGGWALSSSGPEGRIQITDEYGAADGSTFALVMDCTVNGTYVLNEAVWTVDLSNVPSPILTFHHAEWGDEEDSMPTSFTGSANGDGVSISEDGTTWYRVLDAQSLSSGVWQPVTVDLAAAAASAGINIGSSFRIKFQQYDNYGLTTDGRGYDQITIASGAGFPDWYRFRLEDGVGATLAVQALSSGATADVDLFASDGTTLLGSGTTTSTLSSVIRKYVDSTTDGVPETYFAHVSCSGGNYVLLVTRSATFDIESNDSSANPQDLTDFSGVLGYVEAGADDYYEIAIPPYPVLRPNVDLPLRLFADLPAAGPFAFGNPLAQPSGSLLRMELYAPGGAFVAGGSADLLLSHVPPGTYLLRVFAEDGASGEYVLSRVTRPDACTGIQRR